MIKVIYCIVRKPHLTSAQFHERWRDRHGKLVLERAPHAALFLATSDSSFMTGAEIRATGGQTDL